MFKSYVCKAFKNVFTKRGIAFQKLETPVKIQPERTVYTNPPKDDGVKDTIPVKPRNYSYVSEGTMKKLGKRKTMLYDPALLDRLNLAISTLLQFDVSNEMNKNKHVNIKTKGVLAEQIEPLLLRQIMLTLSEKKPMDNKKIHALIIINVR
jgi:hypothetical protein